VLDVLSPAERGEVLAALLVAHAELADEAERIASDLLSSTSTEDVSPRSRPPWSGSRWMLSALA
jgi:hypothetical protein